jgi:hypothetical protein
MAPQALDQRFRHCSPSNRHDVSSADLSWTTGSALGRTSGKDAVGADDHCGQEEGAENTQGDHSWQASDELEHHSAEQGGGYCKLVLSRLATGSTGRSDDRAPYRAPTTAATADAPRNQPHALARSPDGRSPISPAAASTARTGNTSRMNSRRRHPGVEASVRAITQFPRRSQSLAQGQQGTSGQ